MINGNDYDFCSETCIEEYSRRFRKKVVLLEKYSVLKPKVWSVS